MTTLASELPVLLLLAAAVAGAALTVAARRRLCRWRLMRRARRARHAEGRAAKFVVAAGYTVVGEQVAGGYALAIDGRPQQISLRADLLVERRGRRYVVEVKTGRGADPAVSATRRQLLEYRHAFAGVDGLLLADMDARVLRTVDFDGPAARGRLSLLWPLAAAASVAALFVYLQR